MNASSHSSHSTQPEYTGCLPVIVRLFWIGFGNFGLFALALFIGKSKHGLFSLYDLLFGSLVVLCILVRYLDIAYFHGDTANGKPATMRDWRRYVVLLVLASLVIWITAHSLTYFP